MCMCGFGSSDEIVGDNFLFPLFSFTYYVNLKKLVLLISKVQVHALMHRMLLIILIVCIDEMTNFIVFICNMIDSQAIEKMTMTNEIRKQMYDGLRKNSHFETISMVTGVRMSSSTDKKNK